jgi:hypothetical protein
MSQFARHLTQLLYDDLTGHVFVTGAAVIVAVKGKRAGLVRCHMHARGSSGQDVGA